MALIITLALIVLLSALVIALISLSKNSAQIAAAAVSHSDAQAFTRSVANLVVSDYQNELIASSTNLPSLPTAGSPATIRYPMTNTAAVPYRIISLAIQTDGYFTNFSSLVGQSLPNTPIFPTNTAPYKSTTGLTLSIPSGASIISTAAPSLNNRFISGMRWSKPQMLFSTNAATSGALQFSDTESPAWIYVTRAGVPASQTFSSSFSDNTSSNANFVIGRFGFNVYNIGGLLDINSAGYSLSDTASSTNAPYKGALAWADLTALPGWSGTANGTNMVSSFVTWRNPTGMANGYATTVQNWLGPQGFLNPFQTSTSGDRFFVSRQDLLSYQAGHPSTMPAAVLPFLTHWTRAIDTPSYVPNPARPLVAKSLANGGNDGYQNDNLINPNINQVCDSTGTPVMRERFPLSRLDLVANNISIPTGPPSGNAANILAYFGLQWDSTNNQWVYMHGDNNTGNRILRLSEIPQSSGQWSREPDFFEILKAAITAGSIGKQAGIVSSTPSTSIHAQGNLDGQIDYHLMRIGACIIDQYGSGSYPTHISFNGTDVYGLKNLPYLYYSRIYYYPLPATWPKRTSGTYAGDYIFTLSTSTSVRGWTAMLQPTLWNPNAPPSGTFNGPTTFRVVADSHGIGSQYQSYGIGTGSTPTADYSDDKDGGPDLSQQFVTYSPDNAYLQFSTTTTGAASFREPRTLATTNYPTGANTTCYPDSTDYVATDSSAANIATLGTVDTLVQASSYTEQGLSTSPASNPDPVTSSTRYYTGFKLGIYPLVSNSAAPSSKQYTGSPISLILQYLGPDGNYYNYDKIDSALPTLWGQNGQEAYCGPRFDPRTDRFGTWFGYDTWATTYPAYQMCRSLRPSSATPPGMTFPSGSIGYLLPVFYNTTLVSGSGWTIPTKSGGGTTKATSMGDLQWNNTGTHTTSQSPMYYTDPDGVLRTADGAAEQTLSSQEAGLPMTVVSQDAGAIGTSTTWPPNYNTDYSSRPTILNRPFRSVAELGYVLRDEPWKSLDFWTAQSGDASLLDYFTLYEPSTPVNSASSLTPLYPEVAGCLSPNGARAEVYQAVIQGTAKASGVTITPTEAQAIAQALVTWTTNTATGQGPFQNRSELVSKYIGTSQSTSSTAYSGFMSTLTNQLTGTDPAIKARRESVLRALTDSTNTRTWNLMIDIIGQTGRFPSTSTTLDKFMVTGEARYWLYVAIDRYTGKIIDSSLELVNE